MRFSELNLHPAIRDVLETHHFADASPIQEAAIPLLMADAGQNALIMAATGTGKTAAYGLPLIHHLATHPSGSANPTVLVIVPTRELCIQVGEALQLFGSGLRRFKIATAYGGASIFLQAKALAENPAILVATPGRLLDLVSRKAAGLSGITHLVLDEGDELVTPGFLEDINKIKAFLPDGHHTWMVSATLPKEMQGEIFSLVKDPLLIRSEDAASAPEKLEHLCHCVRERHRFSALLRILQANPGARCLIFCRTRKETQELTEKLFASGFPAEALHGDLSQAQREATLHRFRSERFQLLVATNVAARGIDLPCLPLVIQYRLPDVSEVYTHRSGRTARAGRKGVCVTLISPEERGRMAEISRRTGLHFAPTPLPERSVVLENQIHHLAGQIRNHAAAYVEDGLMAEAEKAMASCSREDLIRALVRIKAPEITKTAFGEEKLDAPLYEKGGKTSASKSLAAKPQSSKSRGTRTPIAVLPGLCRCFVNAGTLDGLTPDGMGRFLAKTAGVPRARILNIDIRREFSFIDTDQDTAKRLKKNIRNVPMGKRSVSIEDMRKSDKSGGHRSQKAFAN
ncbi:DEAD/DEAH box helicase [Desulfosarcina sp. OttesenSCG-928-A07]|nr:DEAD/DEAH box helicase [Desulfosarcina sp. OttesenSCG-928-G17]MDL2328376.1 DEAD/DEAH box helicase [Desulfosarcina sp. OttesenSCG-928-A07]